MSISVYTLAQWQQAQRHVAALRKDFPGQKDGRVLRALVKEACIKAGATGAGTTAVGLIPGFGKMLGWAVNLVGDAAMTASIQRDLILRIFALHGRSPDAKDEAQMLSWMGSVGVGAIEAIEQIGGSLIKRWAGKVFGKVVRRGLPLVEILGSSATHIVGTYLLARKVDAYCRGGAAGDLGDLGDLDPRRVRSWAMMSLGTQVDEDKPKTVKDALRE